MWKSFLCSKCNLKKRDLNSIAYCLIITLEYIEISSESQFDNKLWLQKKIIPFRSEISLLKLSSKNADKKLNSWINRSPFKKKFTLFSRIKRHGRIFSNLIS